MSPEVVNEQTHGTGVDIWCLGILLYEMLHGYPPYSADNVDSMKTEFLKKKLEIDSKYDLDIQDLIKRLLEFDFNLRITIDQILKHKAVKKFIKFFSRDLSRQDFELLTNYYYMNSGGTELSRHNSTYARQMKRESMFSRISHVSYNSNNSEFDQNNNMISSSSNFKPFQSSKFKNDFVPKTFTGKGNTDFPTNYSNSDLQNVMKNKKKSFEQNLNEMNEEYIESLRDIGFKKNKNEPKEKYKTSPSPPPRIIPEKNNQPSSSSFLKNESMNKNQVIPFQKNIDKIPEQSLSSIINTKPVISYQSSSSSFYKNKLENNEKFLSQMIPNKPKILNQTSSEVINEKPITQIKNLPTTLNNNNQIIKNQYSTSLMNDKQLIENKPVSLVNNNLPNEKESLPKPPISILNKNTNQIQKNFVTDQKNKSNDNKSQTLKLAESNSKKVYETNIDPKKEIKTNHLKIKNNIPLNISVEKPQIILINKNANSLQSKIKSDIKNLNKTKTIQYIKSSANLNTSLSKPKSESLVIFSDYTDFSKNQKEIFINHNFDSIENNKISIPERRKTWDRKPKINLEENDIEKRYSEKYKSSHISPKNTTNHMLLSRVEEEEKESVMNTVRDRKNSKYINLKQLENYKDKLKEDFQLTKQKSKSSEIAKNKGYKIEKRTVIVNGIATERLIYSKSNVNSKRNSNKIEKSNECSNYDNKVEIESSNKEEPKTPIKINNVLENLNKIKELKSTENKSKVNILGQDNKFVSKNVISYEEYQTRIKSIDLKQNETSKSNKNNTLIDQYNDAMKNKVYTLKGKNEKQVFMPKNKPMTLNGPIINKLVRTMSRSKIKKDSEKSIEENTMNNSVPHNYKRDPSHASSRNKREQSNKKISLLKNNQYQIQYDNTKEIKNITYVKKLSENNYFHKKSKSNVNQKIHLYNLISPSNSNSKKNINLINIVKSDKNTFKNNQNPKYYLSQTDRNLNIKSFLGTPNVPNMYTSFTNKHDNSYMKNPLNNTYTEKSFFKYNTIGNNKLMNSMNNNQIDLPRSIQNNSIPNNISNMELGRMTYNPRKNQFNSNQVDSNKSMIYKKLKEINKKKNETYFMKQY